MEEEKRQRAGREGGSGGKLDGKRDEEKWFVPGQAMQEGSKERMCSITEKKKKKKSSFALTNTAQRQHRERQPGSLIVRLSCMSNSWSRRRESCLCIY